MKSSFVYNPPTEPWLSILYKDKDMLIVDKPSGLLSIPGKEHHDSVLTRVLHTEPHAYAVHRLDMDTSGLLIIALRKKAEKALMEAFRLRKVHKRYVALVDGILSTQEGEITAPLSRREGHPPRSFVDQQNGKEARTRYAVLNHEGECTRLELFPYTGRSHQLRVHLLHIGHPIVGDRFYNHTENEQEKRLMLHAQQVSFPHPYHGRDCFFESSVPF